LPVFVKKFSINCYIIDDNVLKQIILSINKVKIKMFIKVGDGVITDIVKTYKELTDKEKEQAERVAKEVSRDSDQNKAGDN